MRERVGRRGAAILLALLAAGMVVAAAGAALWLDPGDQDDRTTDLVTPTPGPEAARAFMVEVEASRVDFVTRVRGVALRGTFPVAGGTITLEPVGEALRVVVGLEIDVDRVETGNAAVDQVLRAALATGDYPIAFYVATSEELVPVTEEVIAFAIDGMLDVHNVAQPHRMAVEAQAVGAEMWAVARSELDLGQHGVQFPAIIGDTVITLEAHLTAVERTGQPGGTEGAPRGGDPTGR